MICLKSLPELSTIYSRVALGISRFYSKVIRRNLLMICSLVGFKNLRSKQWLTRDANFLFILSLQMQIMGVLDYLITAIKAAIPPRSPAPTPSTSSIIMTLFFFDAPPNIIAFEFSLALLIPPRLK